VRYLFLGTHNDYVHYECIDFLRAHGYRIIGSADVNTQTFMWDGLIVASRDNEMEAVQLGTRKHTPLRKSIYQSIPTVEECDHLPPALLAAAADGHAGHGKQRGGRSHNL